MCSKRNFANTMLSLISVSGLLFCLYGFKDFKNVRQFATQIQEKLNASYFEPPETDKIKRFEIILTDDGFFRYRKYFMNGKQEYFSFHILRFEDLDYLGASTKGTLILRTKDDDVIVQTYNDPKGNIDSMARALNLPMKQMEPEDLQMIRENLFKIRKELQD